jgi:hypothetical protein
VPHKIFSSEDVEILYRSSQDTYQLPTEGEKKPQVASSYSEDTNIWKSRAHEIVEYDKKIVEYDEKLCRWSCMQNKKISSEDSEIS